MVDLENMAINKAQIDTSFADKMQKHSADIGMSVKFDEATIRAMSDSDIAKVILALLKEVESLGNRVLVLEQANNAPLVEVAP